ELKLKLIGLTTNLDLIAKLHYEEAPKQDLWGYGVDLKYYQPAFTLTIGWADLNETAYLHNAGTIDLYWGKHELQSAVDLYTPTTGRGLSFAATKYVAAKRYHLSLSDDFTLRPNLV